MIIHMRKKREQYEVFNNNLDKAKQSYYVYLPAIKNDAFIKKCILLKPEIRHSLFNIIYDIQLCEYLRIKDKEERVLLKKINRKRRSGTLFSLKELVEFERIREAISKRDFYELYTTIAGNATYMTHTSSYIRSKEAPNPQRSTKIIRGSKDNFGRAERRRNSRRKRRVSIKLLNNIADKFKNQTTFKIDIDEIFYIEMLLTTVEYLEKNLDLLDTGDIKILEEINNWK